MNTPPCDMLVLGGTGDLSLHKLLPALYHLHREGRLPGDMRIHTAARRTFAAARAIVACRIALSSTSSPALRRSRPSVSNRCTPAKPC